MFHHEWKSFAQAIEQDIEPATHGQWGRHIMEIMFAAEQSAITGKEVFLESAHTYDTQHAGVPINREHGWV